MIHRDDLGPLSKSALKPGFESAVEAFENAWRDGPRPSIGDYLPDHNEVELLVELVHIDQERRHNAGEPTEVEQYIQQFPQLGMQSAAVVDLLVREFELRRRRGEPSFDELIRRFPELGDALSARIGRERGSPADVETVDAQNSTAPADGTSTPSHAIPAGIPWNDYELIRPLGKGGMGVVWLARQTSLGRLVALKRIASDRPVTPAQIDRFRREAEAAAALDHPGIVPIYEIGEHWGEPYFSLAFVEGQSLAEAIADGPLGPRRAAELIGQVADAVQYAHERGVIHRDLKPANVMLGGDGRPRVTDFGLAKRFESDVATPGTADPLTTTGLGTPAYMPPEQAAPGAPFGPAADVYALGATLYHLLTGRPPFQAAERADILQQILELEPVSPRTLTPTIPRDLETVVLKCLSKRPERRYRSARELADELGRFLRGEPILARPLGPMARLGMWCRRQPIVAGLSAAVAVVLTTGTIVSAYFAVRAHDREIDALRASSRANAKATEARDNLYAAHMQYIEAAWKDGNPRRVRELLDLYRRPATDEPDLRGWEWHFQDRLSRSEVRHFDGHARTVSGLALSPDETRIATASDDGTVRIWDLATGRQLSLLRGGAPRVLCVAFSPDGERVVFGGDNGDVELWGIEPPTRLAVWTAESGGQVLTIAFQPDGSTIATGGGVVRLTDMQLNFVKREDEGQASIAFGSPGEIKLWSADGSAQVGSLAGHIGIVTSIAYSPDGTTIASGGYEPKIRLWDAAKRTPIKTLVGHPFFVQQVAFSGDGRLLVSSGVEGGIKVWDLAAGAERRSWTIDEVSVLNAVAIDGNGEWVAAGGTSGVIRLWHVPSGHPGATIRGNSEPIHGLLFCGADSRLVTSGGNVEVAEVKQWSVRPSPQPFTIDSPTESVPRVAFDPRGGRLAYVSPKSEIVTYDVKNRREIRRFGGGNAEIRAIAFSPDGAIVASAGKDALVRLWDAQTGVELRALSGHRLHTNCLAFSKSGRLLASGEADTAHSRGEVKIWESPSGREIRTLAGHDRGITGLSFSRDERQIATSGSDGFVRIWDVDTGSEIAHFAGSQPSLYGVSYSPDGRHVAMLDERHIKLWDVEKRELTRTFAGHQSMVTSVAFSPDGTRMFTGSHDMSVRVWVVETGQQVRAMTDLGGQTASVAVSGDGHFLAAGTTGLGLLLWDARPLTDETRADVEASDLVDANLALGRLQSDAGSVISEMPGVTEPVRSRALDILEVRRQDSQRLNEIAWALALPADSTAAQYARALEMAAEADRLNPDTGPILNTLGVAQYRAGRMDDAVATLTRSLLVNGVLSGGSPSPQDMGFLAMTHARLNNLAAAKAALATIRGAAATPPWSDDVEVQAILREAEQVVAAAEGVQE